MIIIGVTNLAQKLGLTRETIYKYCAMGMPYNQKGDKRYFDLQEVNNWLMGR